MRPLEHNKIIVERLSISSLTLSICFVEFVCVYLIVWWEEVGQVSLLCQGSIYSFKVAFLHHIKRLQQQQQEQQQKNTYLDDTVLER